MDNKQSFVLYKSFYQPTKGLTLEQKGMLYDAIFQYQIEGVEPEASSEIMMAFMFFKNQFDLDNEKWGKVLEKRRKAGKIGGKAKARKRKVAKVASAKSAKQNKQDLANLADNENENENVNEKENISAREKICSLDEFLTYAIQKKSNVSHEAVRLKYEAWVEEGWVDGKGNPIKNWKTKLLNTLPYLKETAPNGSGFKTTIKFK